MSGITINNIIEVMSITDITSLYRDPEDVSTHVM